MSTDQTTVPADGATRVARVLTEVFHPAYPVLLICLICGVHGSPHVRSGLLWGLLVSIFCAVIPILVIEVAVRRQHVSDRHVTRKSQRRWAYTVCLMSVACGVLMTFVLDSPDLLQWALLTMIFGLLVTGTITLVGPKVSMHTFCLTSLVVLLALLVSPWWLLVLLIAGPAVVFARVQLRHHTPLEVTLGMVLAVVVVLIGQVFMPALPPTG